MTELSAPVVASVAALGVLGTGCAFVLHMRNIRLLGASTASMVTYLIPIFAAVIGVLVLGEDLAWFQPVGAAVVLLGVAIAQGVGRPGLGAGHVVKETELWQRLEAALGSGYSRVWAAEFSLAELGNRTVARPSPTACRARPSGGRSGPLWSCRPATAEASRCTVVAGGSLHALQRCTSAQGHQRRDRRSMASSQGRDRRDRAPG